MSQNIDDLVKSFIEVRLKTDKNGNLNFNVVRESLERIGIASKHQKKLFQSCHILHKKGKYYILHFKNLFALDGKPVDFLENDLARVNTIANLLASWGLIELVEPEKSKEPVVPINQIKILPHAQRDEWELVSKYTVGTRKH